ncbi:MAG: peptidylprolyl isomerase [Marinifilaceae bacterium]
MKRLLIIILLSLSFLTSYSQGQKGRYVIIETNMGNMKVLLYDATPKHQKRFLRLVRNKHFDNTLFYRVIKNFVIQGGSSDSKFAAKGRMIGYGRSMPMSAEIKKDLFHKKGALAAPRKANRVNFFKESDISQFYIVHGRKYTLIELTNMERTINNPIKRAIKAKVYTKDIKKILAKYKLEKKVKEFRALAEKVKKDYAFEWGASTDKLIFTDAQKKAYTTIGGMVYLDKEYTVFGEVVEGLEVIDKIAALKTDKFDRPIKDAKIKIRILK